MKSFAIALINDSCVVIYTTLCFILIIMTLKIMNLQVKIFHKSFDDKLHKKVTEINALNEF